MKARSFVAVVVSLLAAIFAGPVAADVVCPDSSYVEVVFNRTYPENSQFAGQPYDYLTVSPDGGGETFTNVNGIDENDGLLDIEIRVYLRDCQGDPCVGIPAEQITLFSPALCICPGGADADAGTDANGIATFTGTLRAGGCTAGIDGIEVRAEGVFIATLVDNTGRTVKINSTDAAHLLASPCATGASDLAYFASVFASLATNPLHACSDFNERGAYIDASDLAALAFVLGATCK